MQKVESVHAVFVLGIEEAPTTGTIDNYMTNLHSLLLENSNTNALLLTKVRDIVNRLEFAG